MRGPRNKTVRAEFRCAPENLDSYKLVHQNVTVVTTKYILENN